MGIPWAFKNIKQVPWGPKVSVALKLQSAHYFLIGERAKRARHSQVCSIENRDIYIIVRTYVTLAL